MAEKSQKAFEVITSNGKGSMFSNVIYAKNKDQAERRCLKYYPDQTIIIVRRLEE